MKTLIITTAVGLTMLAAPLAAQDATGTTTGYGAATDPAFQTQQGMLPAGDWSRSYDNTSAATADPHLGPEGADGDDGDGEAGADGGEGEGAGEGGGSL